MTIYVDDMRAPFRGMIMCHMIADTEKELHKFATQLGLRRSWFQDVPSGAHYDISLGVRAKAVKAGAAEITHRQAALMCSNRRRLGHLGKPETCHAVWKNLRANPK